MKQKWTIKTKILLLFAAVSLFFMMYSLLNLSPEDKLKERAELQEKNKIENSSKKKD